MSTAFVAGARRTGVAYEDELDDGAGFENAYEQSKYEAELLVHAWSREHGRPALVLRPSILVTDVPSHPELPSHPCRSSSASCATRDARPSPHHRPPRALPTGLRTVLPAALMGCRAPGLGPGYGRWGTRTGG